MAKSIVRKPASKKPTKAHRTLRKSEHALLDQVKFVLLNGSRQHQSAIRFAVNVVYKSTRAQECDPEVSR